MGALSQHWSVGHKERCNRCCVTEGWWNITKIVGMEEQILFLAEKLQGRKRNQHQNAWKKENTCAELTAPLLRQSEAKTHPALPAHDNPASSDSTESSMHVTREGDCNS